MDIKIKRIWDWYNELSNIDEFKNWLLNYLNLNPQIAYLNFREIWIKSLQYYGTGDVGCDWEYFEDIWNLIDTGEGDF